MNPYNCSPWSSFWKDVKIYVEGKIVPSANGAGKCVYRMKIDPCISTWTITNHTCIKALNIRPTTLKLLEEI